MLDTVKQMAYTYFQSARGSHNWDHTLRVHRLCQRIGIAEGDMQKVLSPFGQVDSALAREHDGTGLGVPLVKAMIELHGGTLSFESTPGVGSVVTLRFPPERSIRSEAA